MQLASARSASAYASHSGMPVLIGIALGGKPHACTVIPAAMKHGSPPPTAMHDRTLPVHFSAVHGDEQTLLELAYELEADRPFARIQD